jgi:hypothetical protein
LIMLFLPCRRCCKWCQLKPGCCKECTLPANAVVCDKPKYGFDPTASKSWLCMWPWRLYSYLPRWFM